MATARTRLALVVLACTSTTACSLRDVDHYSAGGPGETADASPDAAGGSGASGGDAAPDGLVMDAADGSTEAEADVTGSPDAADDADTADDGDAPGGGDADDGGGTPTLGGPCAANGATACNGRAQKQKLVCDGTTWVDNGSCDGTTYCDAGDGPTKGTCQPAIPACVGQQPGAYVCDGAERHQCGPDLVTSDHVTCLSAELCTLAAGLECAVCVDGEHKCDAANLLDCGADHLSFEPVQSCGTAALCNAAGGFCTPPACDQAELRCVGDALQVCNPDRTGYDPVEQCQAGLCDAPGGECDTCAPGVTECVSATEMRTCSVDGQTWEPGSCGTPTPVCFGSGQCGECAPGDKRCALSIPQTCAANGLWQGTEACGGGTGLCCSGSCVGVTETSANGGVCARRNDGTLWCWGPNQSGQVGDGTSGGFKTSPVLVIPTGTATLQVAVGATHACSLGSDGLVRCWGNNHLGQLGNGTSCSPEPCGTPTPVAVADLPASATAVSAGDAHNCAILVDGSAWCWGNHYYGQLGDGAGGVAMRTSPVKVIALTGSVAEISLGGSHTCSRMDNGSMWCWGNNYYGQLGNGGGPSIATPVSVLNLGSTVAQISLGNVHTCAVDINGALWCWGFNESGQLGDGTTCSPAPCGKSTPNQVSSLGTEVKQVAAGASHTCALKKDGSLWCWGANQYGQVGNGSACSPTPCGVASPTPVLAMGFGVLAVEVGWYHTCALRVDGTVWCWGYNAEGQVGDGSTDSPKLAPAQVALNGCP